VLKIINKLRKIFLSGILAASLAYSDLSPFSADIESTVEHNLAKTPNEMLTERREKFGLSLEQLMAFNNTDKPNALIILPMSDHNGAFDTPAVHSLISKINSEYDTYVRYCNVEDEVYKVMKGFKDEGKIDLLILGGHGNYYSLHLGSTKEYCEQNNINRKLNFERAFIDIKDDEFRQYLRGSLNKYATIYMMSCSNGEGGQGGVNNITNFIRFNGGRDKKVISAKRPYSIDDVVVENINPFDIAIIRNGEDITYIPRYNPKPEVKKND